MDTPTTSYPALPSNLTDLQTLTLAYLRNGHSEASRVLGSYRMGRGSRVKYVARHIERSESTARKVLQELEALDLVRSKPTTVYGRTMLYWAVTVEDIQAVEERDRKLAVCELVIEQLAQLGIKATTRGTKIEIRADDAARLVEGFISAEQAAKEAKEAKEAQPHPPAPPAPGEIAKSNASDAADQVESYDSPSDCVLAYALNVCDTHSEQKCTHPLSEELVTYMREVADVADLGEVSKRAAERISANCDRWLTRCTAILCAIGEVLRAEPTIVGLGDPEPAFAEPAPGGRILPTLPHPDKLLTLTVEDSEETDTRTALAWLDAWHPNTYAEAAIRTASGGHMASWSMPRTGVNYIRPATADEIRAYHTR